MRKDFPTPLLATMPRSVLTSIAMSAMGAIAALSVFSAAPLAGQAPRSLAAEDFLQLKSVGDPRVSPEGHWVAYTVRTLDLKKDDSDVDIYMVPFAGGDPVRLTASEKPELAPRWSPDGRYLAFLSRREGKFDQVWLLNRLGGEGVRLTDFKSDVSDLSWSPDGKRLALVVADPDPDEASEEKPAEAKAVKPIVIRRLQFKRDGEGYLRELRNHIHVYEVDKKTSAQITSGPYDDAEPAWSPDGRWLAFTSNRTADPDSNENTDIFVVAAQAGAQPRPVVTLPGTDRAPAWSPDGRLITFVAGNNPKDFWYGTSSVGVVAAAGGTPRLLTAELDRNVESPRFGPDGNSIFFLLEEDGNDHLARVPLGGGAVTRVVGGERSVGAFDLDGAGDVAVLATEPQFPNEVWAVAAGSLRRLTHVNDAFLAGIRLAPLERFKTQSADGTPVDVFLTRPPDAKPGKRLPTILRIHGGPTSQYSTEFSFEWQLLAAHGYAVVAANPRGSSGYGRDFSRAIWADWGNKDYQDVMAAVDAAIKMGVADRDRLGVGGWSYGGILTDYVITKTSRFKAAISGASETNFLADYGTDHYQYAWETELGLPWRNKDLYLKLSPWFQVEKITTPTLLLCGTDDMNVPALNSEQLYQALRRLGRETELILYPGQTHRLEKPSFLKDRYDRYLAWYDQHLKATAVPAAAAGAKR
jgi:dipeptidyl aminopeptidase/acylaminoacyl peptidase